MSAKDPYKTIREALVVQRERYKAPACVSLDRVGDLLERTLKVLFPHFDGGCDRSIEKIDDLELLAADYSRLLANLKDVDGQKGASNLVFQAFQALPDIASASYEDALSLLENDPAAETLDEVILCYPGFYAVAVYRLAHAFLKAGVPLLPRMMTEYAHRQTGIEIHPAAQIGRRFFIDHGTGVVIGATAVIGDNVKFYQGVTIGALRIDGSMRGSKRHPTIEDGVVIYANATILGGETVVGRESVIGGNVWVAKSIPPRSRVMVRSCDTEQIYSLDAHKKEA